MYFTGETLYFLILGPLGCFQPKMTKSPVLHTRPIKIQPQAHQKLASLSKPKPTLTTAFEELHFLFLSLIISSFFFIHAMKKYGLLYILSFIFICSMLEGISLHISEIYSGKWNSSYPLKPSCLIPFFYSAWSSSRLSFISHL